MQRDIPAVAGEIERNRAAKPLRRAGDEDVAGAHPTKPTSFLTSATTGARIARAFSAPV